MKKYLDNIYENNLLLNNRLDKIINRQNTSINININSINLDYEPFFCWYIQKHLFDNGTDGGSVIPY